MQKGNEAENLIFIGNLKVLAIQSGNEGREVLRDEVRAPTAFGAATQIK
jgi:hypothetical protein